MLIAIVLSGTNAFAAEQLPTGKIVWSVTTDASMNGFESFALFFQTRDHKHRDYATYSHDNILTTGTDFTEGDIKGQVKVLTVPAGDWEFYNYQTANNLGTYFPRDEFSVPFTIKPGETIYLGSYRNKYAKGHNIFGMEIYIGSYFEVSDKNARDIQWAKKKDAAIGDVTIGVPSYAELKIPLFHAVLPADEAATQPYAFTAILIGPSARPWMNCST